MEFYNVNIYHFFLLSDYTLNSTISANNRVETSNTKLFSFRRRRKTPERKHNLIKWGLKTQSKGSGLRWDLNRGPQR